jgi:hypothetical protein
MLRLWDLLVYGEWEVSQWTLVKVVRVFAKEEDAIPIKAYEVQRNQYGRIRRVRL